MPKTSVITKDRIIDAAFEIARTKGFAAFSARNIANKMGCSTQPIYWTYDNLEVLKQDVIAKMIDYLKDKINSYRKTGNPFLDLGLGYLHTAYTDSVLYKAVYVDNIMNVRINEIVPDKMMLEAIKKDVCAEKMSLEKQKEVVVRSWIFVHGLASLIASGVVVYDEEKNEKLLLSMLPPPASSEGDVLPQPPPKGDMIPPPASSEGGDFIV
jgi:AcrR family transcriptional regulator